MRKELFTQGEIYHIYNRGTDKREIFGSDIDRYRFLTYLVLMNNAKAARNIGYYFEKGAGRLFELATEEKYVSIAGYVLMPNHYHLILVQLKDNGIRDFMQKLGTAYAMYYNTRYERSGVLFQGRYKAIRLTRDGHYDYLPFYTHANPLKLYPKAATIEEQIKILENYPWSSYREYAGFPSLYKISDTSVLKEFFDSKGGFTSYMKAWLSSRSADSIEAGPQ